MGEKKKKNLSRQGNLTGGGEQKAAEQGLSSGYIESLAGYKDPSHPHSGTTQSPQCRYLQMTCLAGVGLSLRII